MAPNVAPGPGACSSSASAAFGGFGGGVSSQSAACVLLEVALVYEQLGERAKALEAVEEAHQIVRRENLLRSFLRMLPMGWVW